MYSVSELWGTLIADPEHWFETKAIIAGTEYGQDQLMEMSVALRMFSEQQPGVGGCLAGELKLKMLATSTPVPRMARIEPYVRVTNGAQTSEWIPQGKYFIDTRETTRNDDGLPITTFTAFDSMLKAEGEFPPTTQSYPRADIDVVKEIAKAMGLQSTITGTEGIDDRTIELMTNGYQIGLPVGYTMREVLSNIASMYAGNWYMNYDGQLLLSAVNGIPVETNYLVDNIGDAITFGGDRILV